MQVVILAGFLGSGKTTVALQIAQAAQARGRRVALIVNERGETGVDNQLAARLGFDLRELLGGCICCSLVADLAPALEVLAATSRPDLVIVEPSGIAEPAQVRSALQYARIADLELQSVGIVDAQRIAELMDVITPLVTRQIQNADLAIIAKVDVASTAEIGAARRIVAETSPATPVFEVNAKDPLAAALTQALRL